MSVRMFCSTLLQQAAVYKTPCRYMPELSKTGKPVEAFVRNEQAFHWGEEPFKIRAGLPACDLSNWGKLPP